MKYISTIILLASITFILISSIQESKEQKYTLSSDQQLKVSGTSSIHDWEMISTKAEGNTWITISGNKITGIKNLNVNLQAASLKSGKKGMDDNAYKSLNTSKYPKINFELTEVLRITNSNVKIRGKLTISGISQFFTFDLAYNVSNNAIRFTGSFPLTFKQYNINPPTAMLGTIKTGNDLRITFDVKFNS